MTRTMDLELWELIKKIADKDYFLSIDPGCKANNLLKDSVAIRLSDIHSPRRMMINVELKRGVSADGAIYYDPNEAIKLAIAYMLDEMEKEVKK